MNVVVTMPLCYSIGRTGRAGKKGFATALFSDKDSGLAKSLLEILKETQQEVPGWLQEYARRHPAYGQKSRRGGGGNRFGGRDFRQNNCTLLSMYCAPFLCISCFHPTDGGGGYGGGGYGGGGHGGYGGGGHGGYGGGGGGYGGGYGGGHGQYGGGQYGYQSAWD